MLTRRRFLHTTLATAAGLALASRASMSFADDAGGELLKRAIPSTGELLPVIGAGTSGSFEAAPGTAKFEGLKEVLRIFFESGATVFDTAPNYAGADAVLGQLLAEGGWRDQCFLATKIAADTREAAEAQWAESLRRLRTDRVELLFVHNLRQWQIQLPYARELKEQGKTRYVGVTHYLDSGLPELERVMRSEPLDFIQIHYSVNAPAAAETVLPLAKEKGIAVLINRAFDDGRLFAGVKDTPLPDWAGEVGVTSWAQMFLKFAISHPAVTTVIPATSRPDRQADQLQAGRGPLLSAVQQQALVRMFR
ncbi:aldo/keto reductase [Alcanivorax quisquiliarum]|uniref:Aldo/keto reductase n=1 Tax=Alcanivorax quisquiliarum TaxID=2933565 RepID=A0ABT0E4I5_9GAMM|nr:aldo/keto reductase [Alcanivorax quisquiliarum]MCK0536717.1 aldo/keto reductase [Alcanivorax quisquiliarum]